MVKENLELFEYMFIMLFVMWLISVLVFGAYVDNLTAKVRSLNGLPANFTVECGEWETVEMYKVFDPKDCEIFVGGMGKCKMATYEILKSDFVFDNETFCSSECKDAKPQLEFYNETRCAKETLVRRKNYD